MVPKVGLEPTQSQNYRILSPARLPIPPLRLSLTTLIVTQSRFFDNRFGVTMVAFWRRQFPDAVVP